MIAPTTGQERELPPYRPWFEIFRRSSASKLTVRTEPTDYDLGSFARLDWWMLFACEFDGIAHELVGNADTTQGDRVSWVVKTIDFRDTQEEVSEVLRAL